TVLRCDPSVTGVYGGLPGAYSTVTGVTMCPHPLGASTGGLQALLPERGQRRGRGYGSVGSGPARRIPPTPGVVRSSLGLAGSSPSLRRSRCTVTRTTSAPLTSS